MAAKEYSLLDGSAPVSTIKGVGKKTCEQINKVGPQTVKELAELLPNRYEEFPHIKKAGDVVVGERAAIIGRVTSFKESSNKKAKTMTIDDGTGTINLTWFGMGFIDRMLWEGHSYVFLGKVSSFYGRITISQPTFYQIYEYEKVQGTLVPVYPLTAGLSNAVMTKAVKGALSSYLCLDEIIPVKRMKECSFPMRTEALNMIHAPQRWSDVRIARDRLSYEELYLFLLDMKYRAANRGYNHYQMERFDCCEQFLNSIPYELTGSQRQAVDEILSDFGGLSPARRLIQGDVGCGKTLVAIAALVAAAENGYQGALIAPTEILAEQHYQELIKMLDLAGLTGRFDPVLLTGALSEKEKRGIREKIASGEASMVIGTHAVIQDKVEFKDLALCVIDEQHRFGTEQRAKLLAKAEHTPHSIMMTATPIPRTLGLTIYGDLDTTIMKDKPAMRLPIKTCVADDTWREKVDRFLLSQVEEGHQAYIICPMVEENDDFDVKSVETYTEELRKKFPDLPVGYVHGKMQTDEKNRAMDTFSSGETKVLISTTVVEVGVNVPNATLILIENAERFGMLQLHQLRGRVGRGKWQSYCILMNGSGVENERLEEVASTTDGFKVAESDYRMRGTGELLGVKQSGDAGFHFADLVRDEALLRMADQDSSDVISMDPGLAAPEHRVIRKRLGIGERA